MNHQKTPLIYFSRFISILFHPVFLPSLVYAYLLHFSRDLFFGVAPKSQQWWLIIIAYITITFPLLTVFLLWRLKFIDSMHMRGLKERYGPLIASMLFYFWTFWLFHKQFQAPMLLQSFLLGVFLTTVMLFMATIFFKISLHTGAWGNVVMFALLCVFYHLQGSIPFLLIAILLGGLVGTSRLQLKEHSNKQVYAGYIIGVIGSLISYFIIKTFI